MAARSIAAAPAGADPGNEDLLHAGTATVRLYLAEVHRAADGSVAALSLAWIPRDIEKRCSGRDLGYCADVERKRGAHKRGNHPSRLLVDMVSDEGPLRELAKRWYVKPGLPGVEKITGLSRSGSLKARVRWKQWSNGENFAYQRALK